MSARPSLSDLRRDYAAEIMRAAGVHNPRVEAAFAATPREAFLTPPPWRIFSPGGLVEKHSSDPADLYDDMLVVLDAAKGINNGQPSLHAAWIAAVDPKPRETVLHIGVGAGYYTAVLATLVGPEGRVDAYEIDQRLAELARRHLARFPQVVVHATSGAGQALPRADVIYVNAAATAPDPAWLRALEPGGRLIFPWQPKVGSGVTLLIERVGRRFRTKLSMAVGFIPCAGAQAQATAGSGDLWSTQSVWLAEDRDPDDSATAVFREVWFSSDPV